MPLYKKTISKARVKTQSSFISPLLSQSSPQTQIKNLIKNDYKGSLHIPTKKKLLEPLINISNDGDLLEKLRQKSFKNSSKTFIEVSNTKESLLKKDRYEKSKVGNNGPAHKFADLIGDKMDWADKFNIDNDGNMSPYSKNLIGSSTQGAKSKVLSRTKMSDLSTETSRDNKKLKTDSSMTITTKIEISSNTDGNIFNIKKACENQNSQLGDMLNDSVMNNLRMNQQLIKNDDLTNETSRKISIKDSDRQSLASISNIEEDESEIDASLRSILDDVVDKNIMLCQNMIDDDFQEIPAKTVAKKSKVKNMQDIKSKTKQNVAKVPKNKSINTEESEAESLRSILDDVVNTNIILSQKMVTDEDSLSLKKKTNKKKNKDQKPKNRKENTGVKKSSERPKESIRALSKSMEKIDCTQLKKQQPDERFRVKSFNKIRALCSEDNDQLELLVASSTEANNSDLKNKDSNLKAKIKSKYLIEKENSKKSKFKKYQDKEVKGEKIKNKQLNAKNSIKTDDIIIKRYSNYDSSGLDKKRNVKEVKKARKCPPKSNNMIFTSADPKKNEMNLKKLLELQEERDVGLYVYCDTCDKVRYLQGCKDPLELPAKWYCHMNPDPNYNKCSDPDCDVEAEKDDLIIFNQFNAGSITWAKMDGFPWWPAMVDDDPDLTDYFWIDDEITREPSWYHVTFFDSSDVTRAWIRTAHLEPFEKNANSPSFKSKQYDHYRHRLQFAIKEAKAACKMTTLQRLRHYSFVTRYFKKHNRMGKIQKEGRQERIKKIKTQKKDQLSVGDNTKIQAEEIKRQDNVHNEANLDDNDDFDNLASNDLISHIFKTKKCGKNKIVSDDDILDNIDFNNLICDENAFEI